MRELKAPKKHLVKKMNHLILDNQSAEIKLLLFKKGSSIPKLYREIKKELERRGIYMAESTFKNMLMPSDNQRCDWVKRLRVIDIIFEYLDPEKIEMAYEGVKYLREKEIRSIMELLKSDYKDKREYTPIETLRYEMENVPNEMKTIWESYRAE